MLTFYPRNIYRIRTHYLCQGSRLIKLWKTGSKICPSNFNYPQIAIINFKYDSFLTMIYLFPNYLLSIFSLSLLWCVKCTKNVNYLPNYFPPLRHLGQQRDWKIDHYRRQWEQNLTLAISYQIKKLCPLKFLWGCLKSSAPPINHQN